MDDDDVVWNVAEDEDCLGVFLPHEFVVVVVVAPLFMSPLLLPPPLLLELL
jgi:hypothetical protein